MDLTAIKAPFGLLDEVYGAGTQETLRAHGGPYEMYGVPGHWKEWHDPAWAGDCTYRVKPAPPKPREWYAVGRHLYDTEAEAVAFRQTCADMHGPHHLETPIIHVREVLP